MYDNFKRNDVNKGCRCFILKLNNQSSSDKEMKKHKNQRYFVR